MGWTDSHLFEFVAGDGHWGIPDPYDDFGHQPIDARKARLSDIVRETGAKTIHYLYDFGDSWDHVIKLEKWFDNASMDGLPLLLDAAGRCPPEDVGGVPGYAGYLEAIGDPTHPEHESMRIWGPERFDPNIIDRQALPCCRQRLVRNIEAAPHHNAIKIEVKRNQKGRRATLTLDCGAADFDRHRPWQT